MLQVHARESVEEERTRLSVLSKDEILDCFMGVKVGSFCIDVKG